MSSTVGVLGAGKFGITISKLLSENVDVILYSRNTELIQKLNEEHVIGKYKMSERVRGTTKINEVPKKCDLIIPVIASAYFRKVMQELAPFIHPYHIIVHGTKGLDYQINEDHLEIDVIPLEQVHTMSQVIKQETSTLRVGCISGPNLADEILDGQPTATVIASEFDEVISLGQKVLGGSKFFVFGSHDLKGSELAGVFKNIIAIGSGILNGQGMGRNMQAMIITRGLREIVTIGQSLGADSKAFLGTAGVGDLIATCMSEKSRNFQVGYNLSQGQTLKEILANMSEVAEGVKTIKIANQIIKQKGLHAPITSLLYQILFEELDIKRGIHNLMRYPYGKDVDFL